MDKYILFTSEFFFIFVLVSNFTFSCHTLIQLEVNKLLSILLLFGYFVQLAFLRKILYPRKSVQ
jgi:hypothetical protein